MAKRPTIDDHMKLIRTAWPWVVGFWVGLASTFTLAIEAGWIDLPAKANDLRMVQQTVDNMRKDALKRDEAVHILKENQASQKATTNAIKQQLNRIEKGQDLVLQHLLGQNGRN